MEARNKADALVFATEKSLKDVGDKIDPAIKADVESKLEALKKVMDSGDVDAIKKASDDLTNASHALAEQLYKNAQAQNAGAQGAGAAQDAGQSAQANKQDDDVVDVDFTEVKK